MLGAWEVEAREELLFCLPQDEKHVQKEMVSQLWLLVQMIWAGRAGMAGSTWQAQTLKSDPLWGGQQCWEGGPRRAGPALPARRVPSLVGG